MCQQRMRANGMCQKGVSLRGSFSVQYIADVTSLYAAQAIQKALDELQSLIVAAARATLTIQTAQQPEGQWAPARALAPSPPAPAAHGHQLPISAAQRPGSTVQRSLTGLRAPPSSLASDLACVSHPGTLSAAPPRRPVLARRPRTGAYAPFKLPRVTVKDTGGAQKTESASGAAPQSLKGSNTQSEEAPVTAGIKRRHGALRSFVPPLKRQ